MNVLVDSWAWIEYFKGTCAGEKVKELLENSQDKIIVSTINIAEVYNSFLRDYSHPDNDRYAKVLTGDPHFRGLNDVIFLERSRYAP